MNARSFAAADLWKLESWITSAHQPGCDFPLQNLPFCVREAPDGSAHVGVGIGDLILDLHGISRSGLLDGLAPQVLGACTRPHLNELIGCGRAATSLLRKALITLLAKGAAPDQRRSVEACLSPIRGAHLLAPVRVGHYTDFYASLDHATSVGRLFRPDQPLLPNYKFLPIGYHGRASSLVVSDTPIVRPSGQIRRAESERPSFEPSRQLDYELELGVYVVGGNSLGRPIPIDAAEDQLFGVSLLNDWSARDIQAWEYQPLGPFLGKSFATSVSPWVVSFDALAPFRVPLAARDPDDPVPLPYLNSPTSTTDAVDVQLEVSLTSAAMRKGALPPVLISSSNSRDLYWTFAQMVAHHTSNGCNLLPGDLLGSGTISSPQAGSGGCLLEQTRRGASPMDLPTGETRAFLEDGDEVILSGFCERPGLPRIGLGQCRGIVSAALA